MSLIAARNVSKSYGDRCVLDSISFAIEPRDRIGLIGANGSGKTTLLRLIQGLEETDSGEIIRRRKLSFVAVEQMPLLAKGATVEDIINEGLRGQKRVEAELHEVEIQIEAAAVAGDQAEKLNALLETQSELNIRLEQLGGWNVQHLADAAMDALQVPALHRDLETLSLGERRRLALCVALIDVHDLLILDEPTNHLDVQAIDWLEKTIDGYPGAVLMVSHDRYLLDRAVKTLIELDRGDLRRFEGNYTEYMIVRAERYAVEHKHEQRRQKDISSELQWSRRSAPARTSKQRARLDRLDLLMADKPKPKSADAQFRIPHPARISKTIIELQSVGHRYDDRQLFESLDLIMKKGDRIGIIGANGAGKSTLLKIILEEIAPTSGKLIRGPNTKIVYVDQARTDLDLELSVLDAVGEHGDFVYIGDQAVTIQGFLSGLLFDGATQRMKVSALSGGERSRAVLAKNLCRTGNLIILDEPTNDLDLPTLRVLEDALAAYPGCALIVSHDRYFLDRVCTAILAFEDDGLRLYEGNYSQYCRLRDEHRAPEATLKPIKQKNPASRNKTSKKKRTFREEQEFTQMEEAIMNAESGLESLQTQLNDPDELRRLGSKVSELIANQEAARKEVERLYARWEELAQYE